MKEMKIAIRIFAVGFAASLALVSCAKQEAVDNGSTSPAGGARTIAVSFANGSTKSVLEGLQPKFVAGDVIKVSNGSATENCPVDIDGSGNASITTSLTGTLTAVYPYTAAKMSGNTIEGIIVPAVQDGTFASANICMAEIAEGAPEATFKNQTAIFKLFVPEKKDDKGLDYVAKSVVVRSKDKNIYIADGNREITVGDGSSSVMGSDGFCYVSIIPGIAASNFIVRTGDGGRELTGDGPIAKSTLYSVALPVLNGREYVEITMTIGETIKTLKMATMNIGATKTEDPGLYFAYGDVVGQTAATTGEGAFPTPFDWAHDPFNGGAFDFDQDYFNANKSEWLNDDTLKPEYDAAQVNWGGSWRMPTGKELDELLNYGNSGWDNTRKMTRFGYYNSTYVPLTGFGTGSDLKEGDMGYYRSSSLHTDTEAFYLNTMPYGTGFSFNSRFLGFVVRPVSD